MNKHLNHVGYSRRSQGHSWTMAGEVRRAGKVYQEIKTEICIEPCRMQWLTVHRLAPMEATFQLADTKMRDKKAKLYSGEASDLNIKCEKLGKTITVLSLKRIT